jgi:protein TonB
MSAAAPQLITDSYTWGFPGAPIQIRLDLEVVRRLRKQIQDSEKGPGVLSACGLLTGETHQPGVTRILGFQPLQTLDAASVEAARDGASDKVVGFYRTTPAGLVSMQDDDRALAASFFSDPKSVFLLVETGKSTIGAARFCFWGDGEIFDWPLMAFPFDAAELAVEEGRRRSGGVRAASQSSPAGPEEVTSQRQETQPPSGPVPVSPVERGQESRTPPPAAERRQTSGRWWLAAAAVAIVSASALAGAFLYFRRGSNLPVAPQASAPRTEVQSPLGLSVERLGNDLRVSWNGNADWISKADFGMLLIRGSAVSRDVPLSADELRAGSVVYASPVDQLRFQLTVVSGGQVAREFLTIVLPQSAEPPPVRASITSSPSGNSGAVAVPRPPVSSGPAIPTEYRQFKETRQAATATSPRIDEPPPVSGAVPVNSGTPSLLNQPAVSPNPPAVSINQVPVSPVPVDVPARGTAQGQASLAASGAQPPVATHQVVPPVPTLLRAVTWKLMAVDVNVSVDASGRVVKAEAAAKPGLHPLLRDAAVQAALQWKFQPAQFNGHAVPANIILQFNFAKSR